jgi:hypothetical protein
VSSFDVWVNSDNVVEKIAITSSAEGHSFAPHSAGSGTDCPNGNISVMHPNGTTQFVPAQSVFGCGNPITIVTSTDIVFANLGAPETITAPVGAIDQPSYG